MKININKLLLSFIVFLFFSCTAQHTSTEKKCYQNIIKKLDNSVVLYQDASKGNPRSIDQKGKIILVLPTDWTSGFYPGCLWIGYQLTKNPLLMKAAEKHTEILKDQMNNTTTHDMGFKMLPSYGRGYQLTKNKEYKAILIKSAKSLTKRFNPKVGCIRSWDHHADIWEYPVIIDNMMNLELLFWAYDQTHDSLFYKIAVSHANQTMKNHFRKDYSTWHVVDYDSITGNVIKKTTHQGYSDSSVWSRGEAWALYGFTMAYRYTKDTNYLNVAKHVAHFILNNPNLPKDKIPYWDYDAPNIPLAHRDASAAAITSSALYELSKYVDKKKHDIYFNTAQNLLDTLCVKYQTPKNYNYFLLDHSTGNFPAHSEINVPIIYADYYFLEALSRRNKILNKNKLKTLKK